MKKHLLSAFALLFAIGFAVKLQAQSAADEAALRKMWNDVWQAYESGDEAKMWSFYSATACEIYPDGSMICGKENIRAGYETFKTMLEGTPSWSMSQPELRFVEPSVALVTADVTADIKLKGGQQIGGKSKFMVLVHKVNGQWLIEFDSQTPVIPMPGSGQ